MRNGRLGRLVNPAPPQSTHFILDSNRTGKQYTIMNVDSSKSADIILLGLITPKFTPDRPGPFPEEGSTVRPHCFKSAPITKNATGTPGIQSYWHFNRIPWDQAWTGISGIMRASSARILRCATKSLRDVLLCFFSAWLCMYGQCRAELGIRIISLMTPRIDHAIVCTQRKSYESGNVSNVYAPRLFTFNPSLIDLKSPESVNIEHYHRCFLLWKT